MFPLDPITLGALSFALVSLALAFKAIKSSQKRLDFLEDQINALGKDFNAMSHSTIGLGRKVSVLAEQNHAQSAAIEEIQKNDPIKVSYSEAARLVRMGAGISDLMSACGISRPEAELVTALTKKVSAPETDKPTQQSEREDILVSEQDAFDIPTLNSRSS